ncbi:hypothetical protein [Streptomyces sp. NBC_00343]|nr:hypothetical protein [Streptomyces sp. NBC_00343]
MSSTESTKPPTRAEYLVLLRAALVGAISGAVRAAIDHLLG